MTSQRGRINTCQKVVSKRVSAVFDSARHDDHQNLTILVGAPCCALCVLFVEEMLTFESRLRCLRCMCSTPNKPSDTYVTGFGVYSSNSLDLRLRALPIRSGRGKIAFCYLSLNSFTVPVRERLIRFCFGNYFNSGFKWGHVMDLFEQ